jgi:hypothetical protein
LDDEGGKLGGQLCIVTKPGDPRTLELLYEYSGIAAQLVETARRHHITGLRPLRYHAGMSIRETHDEIRTPD